MNNTFSLKILESYIEMDKIQNKINSEMFNFITKANELVELSEDDYQIEKTLKLNKISLKGYVLDSECCVNLSANNINDYSIDELKNYLIQYEKSFNVDYSNYFLALSLYEAIEEIENLVDNKVNLEIQKINELIPNINNIKSISQNEFEKLYLNLKNQLDNYFKDNSLNEKSYNICIQILNDIFNFYINGYPNIPDEYLYHSED